MRFFGRKEIRTVRTELGPDGKPHTYVNIETGDLSEEEAGRILAEQQTMMERMFGDMERTFGGMFGGMLGGMRSMFERMRRDLRQGKRSI